MSVRPARILLSLLLVLGLAIGCSKREPGAGLTGPAPDFSLPTLEGKVVRLSDFRGQVVLLDFWATWCPPCRAAIPHVVDLQQVYGPRGFTAVGLNMDQNRDDVAAFLSRSPVTYPIVQADEAVRRAYGGVVSIPQVFVVDRKGNIREHFQGYNQEIAERMKLAVENLLKEGG